MPRDLEPVPLVKRGQIVDVHSKVGGVAIVTAAKALSEGAYGDVVELRTGDRGRERFSATVTGPGHVTVRGGVNVLAMGERE
jgi:flagella basal body P-ring formation protein FlgA